MSDPLFNSKRDQAKLPDDDCISTLEVEQVGTPAIGTGASDTWDVGQSFELNQEATSMPSHATSAPEVMGIAELTSSCFKEIRLYQDGELEHEMYCMELLRRATLQGNQDAWKSVQELLGETVRSWIAEHPRKEEACSLESQETYVDQAFARFYLLIVSQQKEFNQLSACNGYLVHPFVKKTL